MKVLTLIAAPLVFTLTPLRAQDVGFTNAWLEDKADGTTVWLDVGNDPGDPVLLISDPAPHVDRDFRGRTQQEVIRIEELDSIDVGIGLLSMHSPFEVSSKVDLWHLHRGFVAFFTA